jgi:stress response protein SCP2
VCSSDLKGIWLFHRAKFDPAINTKPCMQMIDHLRLAASLPGETYSAPCAFQFTPKELKMRTVVATWQKGRPWIEFSRELRKYILPRDVKIWDHIHLELEHIYSFADLGQVHGREPPQNLRITCQWHGKADLDLSLCGLNRRFQCVGRVSFNDLIFFEGAIEHFPPFREDGNGFEDMAIRFGRIPKQVKLLLVVITSYGGDPLLGEVKILDDADHFELMCHELNSSSPKPGLLFGIFARTQSNDWDFLPALMPVEATKPYTAHAGLKQFIKDSNYVQKLYDRRA